jgi:surface antigen Omp85-like protein
MTTMRHESIVRFATAMMVLAAVTPRASAQTAEPATRQAAVEQAQAEKSGDLHPYIETSGERLMARVERMLSEAPRWHPFLESAYQGGGLTVGAGYTQHVSSYNWVDVRGSYTINQYKRAEAEFVAPRLFHRRAQLSALGGWREATEVGFFGLGTNTPNRHATYAFENPHASATLTYWPTRETFLLKGGVEYTKWSLEQPISGVPVEDVLPTLPGVGADTTYLHTQATIGLDWRPASAYARRGGYYAITGHDYRDRDDLYGFTQVDYEAVQHVPLLREAWALSLHGKVQTTQAKDGQQVPFFMLPHLGGGHTLRGFESWRFRDTDSLLLQAEWRIMANRFVDTAVFYDAGKMAARFADLDLNDLQHDYGFGVRFHGPFSTPLRIEVARSHEGTRLVFATSPIF